MSFPADTISQSRKIYCRGITILRFDLDGKMKEREKIKNKYYLPSLVTKEVGRFLFYWRSQYWTRQQIEDYQNKRLIEIVRFAGKNVPYYRDLFKQIGFDTLSFRGIEDINRIPLLDKEVIRTRGEELLADDALLRSHRAIKTSGSTGTPLNLVIDQNSRANKSAAFVRAMFWAGYYPYRKRFLIKGLSESKITDYGFDRSQNLIFLNCSRLTKHNCIKVAELINKHKPSFYEGYARSFIDFFNIVTENGISLPKPASIFCYGETITPAIRNFIETNYETQLYDHYGNTETTACIDQLPDRNQYLMEDFFYPEILTAEGNIEDSGYGELVSTGFYNYAMPFIRYKTRDYVKVNLSVKNSRYSFRQVDFIEGRMDDCILLPDGRKIYFAEGAIGYANGVITAQMIQDAKDHLIINLVVDNRFTMDQCSEIEKGLHKRIGDSLKISFKLVDELEKKQSGKVPFIVNRIGAETDD